MSSRFLTLPVLIATLASAIGCGKPAAEKQMEAELFERIRARHDVVMDLSDSARHLIDGVDLALRDPQLPTADSAELERAKEGLVDGMTEMRAWMKAFRPPDESQNHQAVMATLEHAGAGLEKIEGNLDRALASAAAVLSRSTHR